MACNQAWRRLCHFARWLAGSRACRQRWIIGAARVMRGHQLRPLPINLTAAQFYEAEFALLSFCSYQLSSGDKVLRVINWIYCSFKFPGSLSLHTLPSAKWRYTMFATDIYSPRKSLTVMCSKFIAFFFTCFIISFLPPQDFLSQLCVWVRKTRRQKKQAKKKELNQQTKKQRKQNNFAKLIKPNTPTKPRKNFILVVTVESGGKNSPTLYSLRLWYLFLSATSD